MDDPFDRVYLRKNYLDLGCADVLSDVFRIFLESSRVKLAGVRSALVTESMGELLNLAHGLKGEAGSVGGRHVTAIAAAMEKAARGGDLQELRRRMPELEHELERLLQAIERELEG
ncbi:Hpt domain-containing protein [Trichlorobacter ammonificans]|nr:Hpt domain-containing protein [Trichlorobacter ammonificans]